MNFFSTCIIAALIGLLPSINAFSQFQYISPKPNSNLHNPETNIILKTGSEMDVKSLLKDFVGITGSISGVHLFRIVLAADEKTILLYPALPFALGETVSVIIQDGFKKKTGDKVEGVSFQFSTHPARSAETIVAMHKAAQNIRDEAYGTSELTTVKEEKNESGKLQPECTFPKLEITSTGNEYDAPVFLRNQRLNDNTCFARQIASNEGDSIYAEFDELAGIDFKINYNGYLTYFDKSDSTFVMMDSSYYQVKKFYMGNGYACDEHEFLVYPDGHSFLMSYDQQIVDMSVIVTGGSPNAIVAGLVIQELDADDNVVFQWRSWDHLEITNAVSQVCLTCIEIDYVHGNSIDIDFDGNLLISCRHLSAILKINKSTGEIMWQMGGENNDFTFVNETGPSHFYYQHHFRLLPDGNYSMFNNANYQVPQASAAKIYTLDQDAKTATLVWEYVHPTLDGYYVFGRAMGSVELLPNGNWLIGWGLLNNTNLAPIPNVTEVDSAGNIVWELRFVDSTLVSYRAFKFDFIRCGTIAENSLITTFVGADSVGLAWENSNNASSYLFQYKLFSEIEWITIPLDSNAIILENLTPESFYEWRVQSICELYNDSSAISAIHTFNTISTSFGINVLRNTSFNLYPNPASLEVTISISLKERKKVNFLLTNLVGEPVYQKQWEANAGNSQLDIPLNQLPKGAYIAQISTKDSIYRQQLIIQ